MFCSGCDQDWTKVSDEHWLYCPWCGELLLTEDAYDEVLEEREADNRMRTNMIDLAHDVCGMEPWI